MTTQVRLAVLARGLYRSQLLIQIGLDSLPLSLRGFELTLEVLRTRDPPGELGFNVLPLGLRGAKLALQICFDSAALGPRTAESALQGSLNLLPLCFHLTAQLGLTLTSVGLHGDDLLPEVHLSELPIDLKLLQFSEQPALRATSRTNFLTRHFRQRPRGIDHRVAASRTRGPVRLISADIGAARRSAAMSRQLPELPRGSVARSDVLECPAAQQLDRYSANGSASECLVA